MDKSETEQLVSTKKDRRLILRNGDCNILQHSSKRGTLLSLTKFIRWVSASWLSTFNFFTIILTVSWMIFGIIYYLICVAHGDLRTEHLPHNQQESGFKPCLYNINNFGSCLLFSIETQHTVGYGTKAPTDECPEAIFVSTVQCIFGFVLQGLMAVIIFAKMTLPKLRTKTLLFSKKAVICPRNGSLCLMFRVGDMRKNHITDSKIRAFLVCSVQTSEGEILHYQQTELALKTDDCKTGLFFNWPVIAVHEIKKDSPLYYFSPTDFRNKKRFEIVAVLEGMILCTGQMTQAKFSYMGDEICWGYKFEELLSFDYLRGEFEADFSKFDQLVPIQTPFCSAAYLSDYYHIHNKPSI